MRLLCPGLLWLLVGFSPAAAEVPEDIDRLVHHRGHALLIGVSDYMTGWDQLPSVKDDLDDLKEGLRPYFETVDTVQSPTVVELRNRMHDFLMGRWNKPDERLFVYYSGHGFTDFNQSSREKDGYITGSDTPLYNETDGKAVENAVPFTDVIAWNMQTRARHVLMVFDACFSGSLFQTKGTETEPNKYEFDGIRRMLGQPIRYFITAGRQNEEVSADSTFAKLLLRGLRGEADFSQQGIISADQLGIYLSREVPRNSQRTQTPQFNSIGNVYLSEGQFFFLTGPAHPALAPQPAPGPAPQPAPPLQSFPAPADQPAPAPLRTLTGHTGFVLSVAFSPDGRTLASGSTDKTIMLWDAASGQLLRTLTGHTGFVHSVAFSPDGRTLVSGSKDNTIKLWDPASGQLLRTLTGHSKSVEFVAFSPDGRTLASGSLDDTIKLWDVASGQPLRTLTGHSKDVDSVAFSPDGRTLASGSRDDTIKLWDVASGQLLRTLTGHTGLVWSVAFSPDGRTLASGSREDKTIKLWDVASGQLLRTLGGDTVVYSVAFSPNGQVLASGSGDKVIIWDVASGQPLRTLTGDTGWFSFSLVLSVAFSPDGRTLAAGSMNDTIKLWDLSNVNEASK